MIRTSHHYEESKTFFPVLILPPPWLRTWTLKSRLSTVYPSHRTSLSLYIKYKRELMYYFNQIGTTFHISMILVKWKYARSRQNAASAPLCRARAPLANESIAIPAERVKVGRKDG